MMTVARDLMVDRKKVVQDIYQIVKNRGKSSVSEAVSNSRVAANDNYLLKPTNDNRLFANDNKITLSQREQQAVGQQPLFTQGSNIPGSSRIQASRGSGSGSGKTPVQSAPQPLSSTQGVQFSSTPQMNHIGSYQLVRAPVVLEAFPKALRVKEKTPVQGGGGLRRRWEDKKHIYEWDSQHGRVEKYNKRGDHLGEYDPVTGLQTKPANPIRNIKKYI